MGPELEQMRGGRRLSGWRPLPSPPLLQAPFFVIIDSIADFCLQHDDALGLLRLEWVSGAGTQTMSASAAQLLLLIRALGVRHLLLDMNTVPDIPFQQEGWLGTYWIPGLVQLPLERLVLVIATNQLPPIRCITNWLSTRCTTWCSPPSGSMRSIFRTPKRP